MDEDRAAEIAATFERIRRPLQWPMENFRRRRISNRRFVGFRFSRVRRTGRAGFAFGFALHEDSVPGVREPPEVVHPDGSVVAVRHRSMRHVPKEIFVLVASDFLMLSYSPLRAAGFLERVTKATTRPG